MNGIRNALTCLALAIVATGCATGRVADLKDCGTLSVGVGLGLDVTAKAGCLLHPSIGVFGSQTSRIGLENRELPLAWKEMQLVWPISSVLAHGFGTAWSGDRPLPVSYMRAGEVQRRRVSEFETLWIPALMQKHDGNPFAFHEITDIQAGATLLVVSARAGINPLEIVDFLLGFVGIDIARDDPKKKDKEKPTTESTPTK